MILQERTNDRWVVINKWGWAQFQLTYIFVLRKNFRNRTFTQDGDFLLMTAQPAFIFLAGPQGPAWCQGPLGGLSSDS